MTIRPPAHRRRFEEGFFFGALVLATGCARVVAEAPLVVLPLPGEAEPAPASSGESERPKATKPPPLTGAASRRSVPDPEAIPTREFFEVELEFSEGAPRLVRCRAIDRRDAEAPARRLGRFALELYVADELVERVRFDFPLLASGDEETFERGLRSRFVVLLPRLPEVTRAILVDRRSGREELVPYGEWFSLVARAGDAHEETSAAEPAAP